MFIVKNTAQYKEENRDCLEFSHAESMEVSVWGAAVVTSCLLSGRSGSCGGPLLVLRALLLGREGTRFSSDPEYLRPAWLWA